MITIDGQQQQQYYLGFGPLDFQKCKRSKITMVGVLRCRHIFSLNLSLANASGTYLLLAMYGLEFVES